MIDHLGVDLVSPRSLSDRPKPLQSNQVKFVFTLFLNLQFRIVSWSVVSVFVFLTVVAPQTATGYEPIPLTEWHIDGFLRAVHDPHPGTRHRALTDGRAIPILARLRVQRPEESANIARTIAMLLLRHERRFDPKARHEYVFVDTDKLVVALAALGEHAKEHIPTLVSALKFATDLDRLAVLRALGTLRRHAGEYVLSVVELLTDGDEKLEVRASAAQALGVLGEHAKEHVPLLGRVLVDHDEDSRVRASAAQALGVLGEHAKDHVPLLGRVLVDHDEDSWVRASAAQALGVLGEHAKDHVPLLGRVLADHDEDSWVRASAAQALGVLGEHAKDQIPVLAKVLAHEGEEPEVLVSAVTAMAVFDKHVAKYVQLIAGLSENEEAKVRAAVASALGTFPERAREHDQLFRTFLVDDDYSVRHSVTRALGALGPNAAPYLDHLLSQLSIQRLRRVTMDTLKALGPHIRPSPVWFTETLRNRRRRVRIRAALAAHAFHEYVGHVVQHIVPLLGQGPVYTQRDAAETLTRLGSSAQDAVPSLAVLLKHPNAGLRRRAATAIGIIGGANNEQVNELADLLNDPDSEVQAAAALALGDLGAAANDYVPSLARLLKPYGPYAGEYGSPVAEYAAQALSQFPKRAKAHVGAIVSLFSFPTLPEDTNPLLGALTALGPIELAHVPAIVQECYILPNTCDTVRFFAHFFGGGGRAVEVFLTWFATKRLNSSDELASKMAALDDRRIVTVLKVIQRVWDPSVDYDVMRRDLAFKAAQLIEHLDSPNDHVDLLSSLAAELDKGLFTAHASSIRGRLQTPPERNNLATWPLASISAHIVLWVVLIVIYPRSRLVQVYLFWNPMWRKVLGLGYVGVLLVWVPFLRRRLFAPFKEPLVADAHTKDLDDEQYFGGSLVRLPSDELRPIIQAITRVRGILVLQGESGAGKSMFLRHFVKDYERLCVFLGATDCGAGVVAAIQRKLEGPAKDAKYLRRLIYAGALDVIIDGVNEASPGSRASVVDFANDFSAGNILLATQPMLWEPPTSAEVYELQGLSADQIVDFLIQQGAARGRHGEAFAARCRNYVDSLLGDDQRAEQRAAVEGILSNPMDLTIVAELLLEGHTPNVFKLEEQAYATMAREYQDNNVGHAPFPLKQFAEQVYKMRLDDRRTFGPDEFPDELAVLGRRKMVVPYYSRNADASARPSWRFRHDKVMDYFLVQAFLGGGEDRPRKHFGDLRFRGTYLQLATTLDVEDARALERRLIEYAAENRDHSVSDDFVLLLRSRGEAQRREAAARDESGSKSD